MFIRARAFAVHVFTAAGAALALAALVYAVRGQWAAMFLCLGLALIVDGVDGTIARWLKVAEVLPRWSGDVLDVVVDFVTYVCLPAYAIAGGGNEHIGDEVNDEIEHIARPAREHLRNLEPTCNGAVDPIDDKRKAEAQKHRRPLAAHRVDQRGERERRACGGENVHRERAGADEHATLDRHARVLTRAAIIRSCYALSCSASGL